jgi:hypothetical protein
VLEEFMLEAGASNGRDMRLEARRIRSGASRDWRGDVVLLDFRAPHRHLVVDVTVTSPRTNTNVLHIGARLPPPDSLELGAQQGKLDADLRTSALLGMPSVHYSYNIVNHDIFFNHVDPTSFFNASIRIEKIPNPTAYARRLRMGGGIWFSSIDVMHVFVLLRVIIIEAMEIQKRIIY